MSPPPAAPAVQGACPDRFAAVRDAFARNLACGDDVGASFAVTIDGELAIDLWGGFADAARTRPWERDTIVNVYSSTKTMSFLCFLVLADRGEIDLRSPVARYWPEFAASGKGELRVADVLRHEGGMAAFDTSPLLEGMELVTYADAELMGARTWSNLGPCDYS